MKKLLLFISTVFCLQAANAADLIDVYNQALRSDPIYQQAITTRLATKEGVPLSLSQLLPSMSLSWDPSITRSGFSGTNFATGSSPRNNTLKAYALTLTVTQTVFDYAQIMNLKGALATSHGADATLNAALQDLMIRTAKAYFAVLQDEDNLRFSEANKLAFEEQLNQIKQEKKVGLKTITDVYTAQASYDSAVAQYIAAQTALINDRENLRVITGKYYAHLSPLSDNFPLVAPKPANPEKWVNTALHQNWQVKAQQFAVQSARDNVSQQFGGHLPVVTLQGTMDRQYSNNNNSYGEALNQRDGPSTQTDRAIAIDITLPILAGGGVVAATNQATYQYETVQQQLEQAQRNVVNAARQSYYGIMQGISQVRADKLTIKSTISSLKGMEESYKVGTETLFNVLQQQQRVLQAQTSYSKDRYAFVNSLLALKQAAGTLSFDDLKAINTWLSDNAKDTTQIYRIKIRPHTFSRKKKIGASKRHALKAKTSTSKKVAKKAQAGKNTKKLVKKKKITKTVKKTA